jgi:hypothetical protein
VPTNAVVRTAGCGPAQLSWEPSQRTGAEPPALYEIYGSNETGFTAHRDARPVMGLTRLLASATDVQTLNPCPGSTYRSYMIDCAMENMENIYVVPLRVGSGPGGVAWRAQADRSATVEPDRDGKGDLAGGATRRGWCCTSFCLTPLFLCREFQ